MDNKEVLNNLEVLQKTTTEYLRENYEEIHKILELYRTRNKKAIKELSKKNPIIGETAYETILNLMRLDGYESTPNTIKVTIGRIKREKKNEE